MQRRQLLVAFLVFDLIVALLVVYNYGIFSAAQQTNSAVSTATAATAALATTPVEAAVPATTDGLIAELSPALLALFAPLPAQATPTDYVMSDALVALGRTLWYDRRLSINQGVSCNTCHLLDRYGVDGLTLSLGHAGRPVTRNAQTVYNAAFHIAQFWDGRSPTVEDQAGGPIMAAAEMGMESPEQVELVLRSIPGYGPLFAAAFPGDPASITLAHVARALGAFERGLTTPSRFDHFLAGDYGQLSVAEQHGLATFIRVGCVTCHSGAPVGGLLFRKLGEIEPYPTEDLGRYTVTGLETDRYVFKVQSLRNVAQTGPYLHDGSIPTLEEMVRLMAHHQLGRAVSDAEVHEIVTFLQTLTGELPHAYIAPPPLPENGPETQIAYQQE